NEKRRKPFRNGGISERPERVVLPLQGYRLGRSFWFLELDLAAALDLVSQRQRPSTPVLGTHEM
ncbi:hypothetical protein SAMN05421663_11497, partial [Terribacillus halophilus]